MKVLGIETATDVCSVALSDSGTVVAEIVVDRPRAHAERLIQQIAEILGGQRLTPGDIDGVAVSIGPGSFTGLRIGVSAAKAIAWALDKPLAAVPTLSALAAKAVQAQSLQPGELLAVAIDSRKGEVYRRLYSRNGDRLEPAGPEGVCTPSAVLDELAGRPALVTGPSRQLRSLITGGRNPGIRLAEGDAALCSAGIIAILGTKQLEAGELADRSTLEPHYLQQFVPKLRTRTV